MNSSSIKHNRPHKNMSKTKGGKVDREYGEIKNMIYHNMLAPGQKIIYKDLAERLDVSITPVVQALKRLERSNLVYYETNKGYFVGELTERMVEDLYHVREALEIQTIPLVIENLDVQALRSIKTEIKRYLNPLTMSEEGRTLMLLDAQFHLKIIEHSNNKVAYDILKDVFEQIYLRYKPEYLHQSRVKEAYEEHRTILSALARRDIEATKTVMMNHIRKGKDHILSIIQSRRNMFNQKRPWMI